MKIGLIHQDDKFGFVVVAKRNGLVIFDSFRHAGMLPSVSGKYEYAWQAQKEADKFLNTYQHYLKYAREDLMKPIVTDISAEEMLENHYTGIYDGLEDKTHSLEDATEEEKDMVYQELKMVKKELETIIEQVEEKAHKSSIKRILMLYKQLIRKNFRDKEKEDEQKEKEAPAMPSMPPAAPPTGTPPLMASVLDPESDSMKVIDEDVKEDLLTHYGEKACQSIEKKHKGAHYVVRPSTDEVFIFDEDNDVMIIIGVNEKLHVNRIIPTGKTRNIYPYHSVDFYQKYWKPIVEEIGHVYIDDASTLVLPAASPLPDTPKGNGEDIIEGWNVKDRKVSHLEVSFRGDNPCWFFDAAKVEKIASRVSDYTEQDYINAIVKCIDPKLESIFDRTGAVIQIIPSDDFIEVDVNFERGIGVVRLTEKQLEIVDI